MKTMKMFVTALVCFASVACVKENMDPQVYRDGTASYYLAEPVGSDDAKGVGPFIMAYLEYIS